MTIAIQTSIDSLESQLTLLREVDAVTREQFACLEGGDYEGVVMHLRRRHTLLDRLAQLAAAPSAPAEDETRNVNNEEIGRLVREILSFDEQARRRIEERQRTVQSSLDEVRRGRSALAGYRGGQEVVPPSIALTP